MYHRNELIGTVIRWGLRSRTIYQNNKEGWPATHRHTTALTNFQQGLKKLTAHCCLRSYFAEIVHRHDLSFRVLDHVLAHGRVDVMMRTLDAATPLTWINHWIFTVPCFSSFLFCERNSYNLSIDSFHARQHCTSGQLLYQESQTFEEHPITDSSIPIWFQCEKHRKLPEKVTGTPQQNGQSW